MTEMIKVRSGQYIKPLTLTYDGKRIYCQFPYDKLLMEEIKMMEGRKWHGYDEYNPRKIWSIDNSHRNLFQLKYLAYTGKGSAERTVSDDPYWRYNQDLVPLERVPRVNRANKKEYLPYDHQHETTRFIITRRQCIIAEEMGLGKTLSVILAMEWAQKNLGWRDEDYWYVAPKAVLRAIERELRIWGCKVNPILLTYESLTKRMKEWNHGTPAPKFLVYDESSRIKTPNSQRSQAALSLANGVRSDWGHPYDMGDNIGFVVLMTGTPAPKSPEDWWHQCEVACPGFLREGDIHKFRNTLGIIVKKENTTTGGIFPQLVTWRDSDKKCKICGETCDHQNHLPGVFGGDSQHPFEAGVNEISRLYKRMHGLVLVKFKKDCLDLPEKQFRIIEIKPTPSILRAAKLITKSSPTVIEGLTRLRELSDGFQYRDTVIGKRTCDRCQGTRQVEDFEEVPETCEACKGKTFPHNIVVSGEVIEISRCENHQPEYRPCSIECPNCDKDGQVDQVERTIETVKGPKDDVLTDLLDEMSDNGRIVIYAGFTASIDKCVAVCHKEGWTTIRLDGRGWLCQNPDGTTLHHPDPLTLFQDDKVAYEKVAFIAHPKTGGIGLTLTAAWMFVFYSNDFDGEARTQAMDRGHRPGMDMNLGVTIVDLLHLPSDYKVRENLMNKRKLELMSLGELSAAMADAEKQDRII